MKKFLSILLCLILTILFSTSVYAFDEISYQEEEFSYRDMRTLEDRITQLTDRMTAAHEMAEAARLLGYSENHVVIQIAKNEYISALNDKGYYQTIYDELEENWSKKEQEYPTASYVWETLMEAGYNDFAIAGILGNMMAECGGQTLNLKWWVSTSSYYGLCQWSRGYSTVWGANLEEQCNFLLTTIKSELDTYGYMYKKGSDFHSFLEMTDEKQTSLMFSKSYERCGSATYKLRQKLATEAYNYFTT